MKAVHEAVYYLAAGQNEPDSSLGAAAIAELEARKEADAALRAAFNRIVNGPADNPYDTAHAALHAISAWAQATSTPPASAVNDSNESGSSPVGREPA